MAIEHALVEAACQCGVTPIPAGVALAASDCSLHCEGGEGKEVGLLWLRSCSLEKGSQHCLELFTQGSAGISNSHNEEDDGPAGGGEAQPYALYCPAALTNVFSSSRCSGQKVIQPHGIQRRPYPLKSRTELEALSDPSKRSAEPASTVQTKSPSLPIKKAENLGVPAACPVTSSVSPHPTPASSVTKEENTPEKDNINDKNEKTPSLGVAGVGVGLLNASEGKVMSDGEPEKSVSPLAGVKTQRQSSLFDLMPASSRLRTEEGPHTHLPVTIKKDAPNKKDSPKSKKSSTKKVKETTKSIAKLAKSSAKKGPVISTTVEKKKSLLDDEEFGGESSSDGADQEEEARRYSDGVQSTALLDVQEPAVLENDQIILCDETPPYIFAAAHGNEPKPRASPAKTPSANTSGGLNFLRTPAFIKFQESYTRVIQTDMKLVDGEYICEELVVYRSNLDGSILSQEAYNQKSKEVVAAAEEQVREAAALAAASPAKTKRTADVARPAVAKRVVSEKSETQSKNLNFFFGKN